MSAAEVLHCQLLRVRVRAVACPPGMWREEAQMPSNCHIALQALGKWSAGSMCMV